MKIEINGIELTPAQTQMVVIAVQGHRNDILAYGPKDGFTEAMSRAAEMIVNEVVRLMYTEEQKPH